MTKLTATRLRGLVLVNRMLGDVVFAAEITHRGQAVKASLDSRRALRALLKAEVERGPDFVRLANALTALYPVGSEEKRLLEAMLLAVPK